MKGDTNQDENLLVKHASYNAFQLLKLFWQSEHRMYAYLSFSVILFMTVFLVGLDVVFSYWSNYFYNALQAYDEKHAITLILIFMGLATCYIIVAVYRYYISQIFGLRWRNWLTKQFIDRWLTKRDYYYLEMFDKRTDNPDQRIQEDIGAFVDSTISLAIGISSAFTTFIAFIYVLWMLSGEIVIALGHLGNIRIPGYLVWVSIIYSALGTYLVFKIGRPLIALNYEQQRREATFRFAGTDVRSHCENVALYRGEHHQKTVLGGLLARALENKYFIILRQKTLLWFTAGYNQVSVILPLMVAMPNYFNRVFMLGGLMQSLRAFASVQDALSFFVGSFTAIAEWRAVMQRLTNFLNHLQEIDDSVTKYNNLQIEKKGQDIVVKNVAVDTPNNKTLLTDVNETFNFGKNYLIKGVSGLGKSTFLRVIAGIWPFASGCLLLPNEKKLMFLSQKPYMPVGTLEEALLFPNHQHPEYKKNIENVLTLCRLENLIPRLHETASWGQELSPGEQQRIAFGRIFLHKPDWIFLDESTSMLDAENESYLYHLITEKMPNTSIVSVGHRKSLESFHDHIIDISKYSPAT